MTTGCASHYSQKSFQKFKPVTIGFIGPNKDFKRYAELIKMLPTLSLEKIDKKKFIQGQTQAIIITAPLKERAELARHSLQAGNHVLISTPIATSYQEFDTLTREANQQNKRLAVINAQRWLTAARVAKMLIDKLGKISFVHIQVNNKISTSSWSLDSEGFIGPGLPLFDLVRWLGTQNPSRLYTPKNIFAQYHKLANNLYLMAELGQIPLLYTTTNSTSSANLSSFWTITIYTQQGYLELSAEGQLRYADVEGQWQTIFVGNPSATQTAMLRLLKDFVKSCQTGKEPEVNLLDGMAGVALTLAAVHSAQTGEVSEMIEPFYEQDEDKIWWRESKRVEAESAADKQMPLNNSFHNGQKCLTVLASELSTQVNKTMAWNSEPNPLEVADRVAQRFMSQNKFYPSYTTDLALEGLLYLFDATGREAYLNYVLQVWHLREKNNLATLDWKILFVCLHFELFLRTGECKYIETFLDVATDFRNQVPRDENGAVAYHVRPAVKRIFVDMLQGYAIFMARAGWLSGDESFFDECVSQYQIFYRLLYNPKTGLWHQGRGWGPASDQISPGHWNRGQGWVLRGLVASLGYLPAGYSKRALMLEMLQVFAASLMRYQDSRGLWHQVTDRVDAYQETSGTALFIHYLYRAIRRDWLPPKPVYLPGVEKGLKALMGFVQRDGLVSNTSHGSGPLMTLEGYLHRPSVVGDPHSVGTTLMACAAPYLSWEVEPRVKTKLLGDTLTGTT